VLGDLAHELLARPGEIPKLLDRRRRNEAAADQAMGQEIRDPHGVVHVALAARDVADVGGVSEHQGKAPLEHVPDRLPIHTPVDSIATCVQPCSVSQSRSFSSPWVVVSNVSTC
jgi:hypothetical protein